MPNFVKRAHVVSFRLSDEEYERLEQVSRACGAHSVSDFVRITTHHAIAGTEAGPAGAWTKGNAFEARIEAMQRELTRLARLIAEGKIPTGVGG